MNRPGQNAHPMENRAAEWIEFEVEYDRALKSIIMLEHEPGIVGQPKRYVVRVKNPIVQELIVDLETAKNEATLSFVDYTFADKGLATSFLRCMAMAWAERAMPDKPSVIELARR